MVSEFVREQKRYTQEDLKRIFHCDGEGAVSIIRRLKEFGVLKTVKASEDQRNMSDLLDEDVEVIDVAPDERGYLYVFTFVGVIIVSGRVLKCYPKYILSQDRPVNELKQVIRVISQYNRSEEQIVNLFNGDAESRSFNMLAVILFLLNDYYNYGVYSNTENVAELNGEGDILWGRTIDENFPIISNGRPYYMELYTRKSVNDENDFFHRLHKAVLTECSKQLEEAQLTELFDIEPLELTDETADEFGDKDYILERIAGELSVQFNTRKQVLLKTMYAYIARDRKVDDLDDSFSLFGTNSFNIVWEKICAEVFSNMLQTQLRNLRLPVPLSEGFNPKERLIDIIEKPKWEASNNDGTKYSHKGKDTLIPDLITISGNRFLIFDAKYYNLYMEKDGLRGQPGIESITKQYLYQLAYRDFTEKHGLTTVKNCFLLPTEKGEYIDKGYAELGMLHRLGLENIAVRLLPAEQIYEAYLAGRKIDLSKLRL